MGKYELNNTDNLEFYVSKQKILKNKTLKVFHKHSHFEVLITKSNDKSESYFITENGKYRFTSNSVMLALPGLNHKTERNTQNTTRFLICFKRNFIEPIARFIDVDIDLLFSKRVLNFTEDKMKEIISVINEMIVEFKINRKYEENKNLRILLATFLHKISEYEFESEIMLNRDSVMYEICDYLKYNYKQNITLEQLSKKYGINKYELCRKMKNFCGSTVYDIITNVRINKAKELLEDTDITVMDIAEKVGYHSSEYFSRKFKSTTGYSPAEYRKRVIN